jgi:hypothetical protein
LLDPCRIEEENQSYLEKSSHIWEGFALNYNRSVSLGQKEEDKQVKIWILYRERGTKSDAHGSDHWKTIVFERCSRIWEVFASKDDRSASVQDMAWSS